jgi:hypothetical protein
MIAKRAVFAGLAAITVYVVFTAIAFFKYPDKFSPFANWLSDLGNPGVNQSGAVFYNAGCIIAGLGLAVFFFTLRHWGTGDRKTRYFLTAAQISGLLSASFLIVSAVFPLGSQTPVHEFASKMITIFFGFFFTFSATALLKYTGAVRWCAYYGFLSALVNFVYGAFLFSVFVVEWVAIGMFIIYVLMLSLASGSLFNQEVKTARGPEPS